MHMKLKPLLSAFVFDWLDHSNISILPSSQPLLLCDSGVAGTSNLACYACNPCCFVTWTTEYRDS